MPAARPITRPTSRPPGSGTRSDVPESGARAPQTSPPPSSRRVIGEYALERQLGSGAMGEVWLARPSATGTRAAVKILHAHIATRERVQRFFARERRAIARLSHPHIVRLHDVGPSYIVTAYIEGSDLARRLQTPCDPTTAVRYTLQIASALTHAHERGVIHRDVKPSNILIDLRGNAHLADFGLATLDDDAASDDDHAGTPSFMPPEQARGEQVGPAADQYALGRTLLEMLAGGSDSNDSTEAFAQLPASLPEALVAVVRRATAAVPADRWPTMTAFAEALSAVDLRDFRAPTRVAPELRVRAPYAWCIGPSAVRRATPDIERADYRLGDLERAGLLAPERCADFRALSGYVEMGWSVYGHAGRLGPITTMSALARATDLVVILHGMFCNREQWEDVALAICRDNAQAVVLVPDQLGCGESRFAEDGPLREHVSQAAIVRSALGWLDLLAVRDLPTVLVGHSISGAALLSVPCSDLGERVSRIAITPIFPADNAFARGGTWAWAFLFGLTSRAAFFKRMWADLMRGRPEMAELSDEAKEKLTTEVLRASPRVLARLFQEYASARPAPVEGLERCLVLIGDDDPIAPAARMMKSLADAGYSLDTIEHLVGNGHYPQCEHGEAPERTARNVGDIAHFVDTMLMSSREGSPLTTQIASTLLAAARPTPPA
jgi:pimeloyl-ACP methyl ester carboxylesterase